MTGNGFTKKTAFGLSIKVPRPTLTLKKPVATEQTGTIKEPKSLSASRCDLASETLTTGELISRAKHHIGTGEASRRTSFRAAAEDIARACDQGATQREVAKGVGKSATWVNRLLKWREGGYVGAPFADKIVHGVNKQGPPTKPSLAGATLLTITAAEPVTDSLPGRNLSGLDPTDVAPGESVSADCDGIKDPAKDFLATVHMEGSGSPEIKRRNLIEALEFLVSTRPKMRAKFALIVEARRAGLGLTWDQLIIAANELNATRTSGEPTS